MQHAELTERLFKLSHILNSQNNISSGGPYVTEISDEYGFSWIRSPLCLKIAEDTIPDSTSYNIEMLTDKNFLNPNGVDLMARTYGINVSCYGYINNCKDDTWDYYSLRDEQNLLWAADCTKHGVNLARKDNYKDALNYYAQAIKICPDYIDAYVAKGAALANLGDYIGGKVSCELALTLDPNNKNALAYLATINDKLRYRENNVNITNTFSASTSNNNTNTNIITNYENEQASILQNSSLESNSDIIDKLQRLVQPSRREDILPTDSDSIQSNNNNNQIINDNKRKRKRKSREKKSKEKSKKKKKHRSRKSDRNDNHHDTHSPPSSPQSSLRSNSSSSTSQNSHNSSTANLHPILQRQKHGLWGN